MLKKPVYNPQTGNQPLTKMDVVKALAPIVAINVAAIAVLVIVERVLKDND